MVKISMYEENEPVYFVDRETSMIWKTIIVLAVIILTSLAYFISPGSKV